MLAGDYDDLPEAAFYMVGNIAEVQVMSASISIFRSRRKLTIAVACVG